MKDDYLWDKTGSDADIERLEETLSIYRIGNAELCAVVSESGSLKKAGWPFTWLRAFGRLRLAVAAACLCLAAMLAGVVFLNSREPHGDVAVATPTADAEIELAIPETRNQPQDSKPDHTAPVVSRVWREKKVAPTRAIARRQSRLAPENRTKRDNEFRLTSEERFAYRQLMLALNVTSSKLKLVNDAVNGADTNIAK